MDGLRERARGQTWAQGITVCDREAPIYEFLEATLATTLDFMVRAASGRSFTVDGEELWQAVAFAPVATQKTIQVKRRPDREAREATVQIRFASLTLRRPKGAPLARDPLTLQGVEVVEPRPPDGEAPVHWLLLTSRPVETLDQAEQIVTFYAYRWLIERFHFALKSGCKLEDSPLRTAPASHAGGLSIPAWLGLFCGLPIRPASPQTCLARVS